MTLITKNLLQLPRMQAPTGQMVLHLKDPLTGKDHYVLISDLLTGQSYDSWLVDEVYDQGERVTFGFKLFESLQDTNEGNVPVGGVGDLWWKEVSESSRPDHLERTINKTAHGFDSGDVLKIDGSGSLVIISDPGTDKRVGLVTEVIDANSFKLILGGYATGLSGLTPGTIYYAQPDGTIDNVETAMPVLHADSATSGYILSSAASGGGSGKAVAETYANIAAMLAAQGDQEEGFWYMATDASTDPTVDGISWAIYQYLGTTDGDLGDYIKVAEFESLDVTINDASETVKGIAELLNQAEAETVATSANAAGTDHTRVVSGRGLWWFFAKIKTLATTWTAALTATDFTSTNQTGTGYRFALFDSSGKHIRNGQAEFNTTTGEMTLRGLDNLDATYTLSIYNLASDLIFQVSNGKFIRVGGTEAIYKISTSVGSGLARTIINANHNMGYIWEDTNGKEYFSLRSTTADERFQIKVKHRFDTLSGLAPEDSMQFSVVANAANGSTTLIGSIPMPNNEEVVFFEIEFRAISNAGSGGFQKIKGAIQRTSGGTVQDFSGQVADAIQRTAGTFTFSVDEDDTANKRININFTNNSSGGLAYLLIANAKWQRVTEPA